MSTLAELQKEITRTEYRLEASRKDRVKRRELLRQKKETEEETILAKSLIVSYKDMIKDIADYQAEYQSSSINDVYRAIVAAKEVIPECGQIFPRIERGTFTIEDEDGINIKEMEGDGLKATASVMVRHSILSHTSYLPFMILDESLAPVNDTNSATFSKYLPLLAKDMLIILIEQKPSVFDNAGDIVSYRVWKEDSTCHVEREVMSNEKTS